MNEQVQVLVQKDIEILDKIIDAASTIAGAVEDITEALERIVDAKGELLNIDYPCEAIEELRKRILLMNIPLCNPWEDASELAIRASRIKSVLIGGDE